MKKGETGYTVVELLVALSILSALSSSAMVVQQRYVNAGKPEALRVEYKTIATAACAYLNDHGRFPATDDELAAKEYIDSVPTLADYSIDTKGKIKQIPR